jgi:hypothetical protein
MESAVRRMEQLEVSAALLAKAILQFSITDSAVSLQAYEGSKPPSTHRPSKCLHQQYNSKPAGQSYTGPSWL